MNLPIIITSWLPGQEEGNVDFVLSEKIGWVSKEPAKVVALVERMKNDPQEFARIKRNIKKVSRPQAALEIAREIFRFI